MSALTNIKDKSGELIPEGARRVGAAVAMYGGWLGGGGIFLYATLEFNPNRGNFAPQWVGYTFFACLFIAIAGTMIRSRFRLSDTITSAFMAGAEMAQQRQQSIMDELMRDGEE